MEPTPLPKARPTDEDGNFPGLRDQVKATFGVIAATTRPLFRTDAVELFPLFLDHLPPRFRQHYTCSCCRGFLRRYGGLAVVGDDGRLTSALWPAPEDVPETFARAVEALRSRGDRPLRQHGRHLFFLLHGCRDTRRGVGRGFFVETLKGEFHPIRSTLEAYTATATLEGSEEATACGLGMSDQAPWDLLLRVTTASGTTLYQIDRWE